MASKQPMEPCVEEDTWDESIYQQLDQQVYVQTQTGNLDKEMEEFLKQHNLNYPEIQICFNKHNMRMHDINLWTQETAK